MDNMIDEIDADGSGTVDWEGRHYQTNNLAQLELISVLTFFPEFKAVMIG